VRTIFLLLLCSVVVASACVADSIPILDAKHISATALDNGLRIVVKEATDAPVVSLALNVKVGTLYEDPQTNGISHFVEHLLFESEMPSGAGERKLGPVIEGMGGVISASTTRDFTTVTITVTPDSVDAILPLLAKTAFESKFTDKEITEVRAVIKREISDRQIAADAYLDQVVWGLAFTKHPYRFPIGGEPEGLDKFTVDALQSFYDRFYIPNNMSIVACGNVKADAFVMQCKQAFGKYLRKEADWRLPDPEPPQTSPRIKVEPRQAPQTLLAYAFHAPAIASKRDVCATDLIYSMLGEGEDSLLKRKLQDEKQLVKGVDVDFITHKMPGLLVISAVCDPRQELPARQAILDVASSLATNRVSDEQLARAKRLIYVSYAFQNEACADQVGSMSFYESIDTYQFAVDYMDEVNRVTPEDILRVAKACLRPDSYSLVVLRSEAPAPGQEACLQ